MTNEIAIAREGARGLEVTVFKKRFSTQNQIYDSTVERLN